MRGCRKQQAGGKAEQEAGGKADKKSWVAGSFFVAFLFCVSHCETPKGRLGVGPKNMGLESEDWLRRAGRSRASSSSAAASSSSATDDVFLVRGCRVVRSSGVCHGHVVQVIVMLVVVLTTHNVHAA